ncbi:DUF4232 domain-containing protein [Streptomyces sp. NPDC005989]|uniref:DUF4232 domain-containing protein n=2 Tax=unclassified Streptomyces TaxID=2593676 RepID=UPI0033DAC917
MLSGRNAGDEKCDLHRYPLVRLGADPRTTVPVTKDSDPDAGRPVTIAPGEEAYAALLVSGGARDEYEAKSITLGLQSGKSGSGAGKPVDVPMPVDTLYADDGRLVTYWTTASGYSPDFIMSKWRYVEVTVKNDLRDVRPHTHAYSVPLSLPAVPVPLQCCAVAGRPVCRPTGEGHGEHRDHGCVGPCRAAGLPEPGARRAAGRGHR